MSGRRSEEQNAERAEVDAVFIDTNILAYAYDESDPKRKKPCERLVRAGFEGEIECYLSNQVLSELFVVLTSRVGKPLTVEKAGVIVKGLIESPKWHKLNYTQASVKQTVEDLTTISASFWDLLLAETMREAGVRKIYSENTEDFKKIPWIEVISPFKGHFDRKVT
jgi:predicted nucleic acid-binding protein